jgi:hypothetical protein
VFVVASWGRSFGSEDPDKLDDLTLNLKRYAQSESHQQNSPPTLLNVGSLRNLLSSRLHRITS